MKIIETTFERLPRERLVIGFEGENLRATVRIDCASVFAEYPNATPALIVKPLFADAYPVVVDRNGTDVDWLITSEILSFTGDGEIQLVFYKDEVICKSAITKIRVCRSLTVTGDMPDPVVQWIDRANAKLAEVDAQIVELEGMVDTATDAATRAEQSESNATTAAANAATSAATASTKAAEAQASANTATAKASEAALSATQARNSAMSAANSESGATAKAAEAAQSAQTAAQKAEQITEAAQIATGKAEEASASATAAQTSATNAASSATAASASETAAKVSETAASTSATQAAQSAQTASTAAQTATQKAADASASATDAATSATNAATSAETASTKAGEAAQSAQAVAETAEQLADSLEQIDQNTQDIAELDERKANIDGYYPDMTVGNAEQLNSSKFVENSEPYTFRTSGGTSDIGNREYLDAVVGGTLAWNQAVRDSASENSTDFAPIVTVTDAVEDAAGVKVKIEPVQNLHGYDHPWPGGGGKNLIVPIDRSFTNDGVPCVCSASAETVSLKGTATDNGGRTGIMTKNVVLPAGTYTLSVTAVSGTRQATYVANRTDNNSYISTATFSLAEETSVYVGANVTKDTVYDEVVHIQIEAGSTATEWTPYSNICPISGFDSVKVTRTGKNLFTTADWESSGEIVKIDSNSMRVPQRSYQENYNRYVFGKARPKVFSCKVLTETLDGGAWFRFYLRDSNGSSIREQQVYLNSVGYEQTVTIVIPDNAAEISLGGWAYSGRVLITDMQMEFSGTATDYEPYAGQTYDITLPTEAGTVYGGTLDVSTGELAVDMANVTFDENFPIGSVNWRPFSGYSAWLYKATDLSGIKDSSDGTGVIINDTLPSPDYGSTFNGSIGIAGVPGDTWGACVRVPVEGLNTVALIREYLREHPIHAVYSLATPVTYTLTASQIRTLLGQNNVWSDAGQTALTYTGTDEHLTLESGKKYLARLSGTDSMLLGSGQEITAAKGTDNVFDLTKMFGSDVADYVYGQGAAFFRKWFPNSLYPYNAGELKHVEGLQSHDMVGFNLLDLNRITGNLKNTSFGQNTPRDFELDKYYVGLSSTNYYASSNISNHSVSENSVGVTSKSAGYGIAFPIRCFPETEYHIRANYSGSSFNIGIGCYDEDGNYIRNFGAGAGATTIDASFTTPSNCRIITVCFSTSASNASAIYTNICINLSHNGSRNGEYEPYEKHSYPLDSTVVLRGIPKVGANGVYWDGDRYLPDGTVERRYGVVDMGTLSWAYGDNSGRWGHKVFYANVSGRKVASAYMCGKYTYSDISISLETFPDKSYGVSSNSYAYIRDDSFTNAADFKAAVQGVLLLYELDTPTTETAQPYHSTQWVSDWGTEEFVSTGLVPVGHETRYPANLRDKLQHLPDAASGNGSYLITQTDGQMVLTPFPAPPSTAGNYVLKATVVNGVATYTWEVAT